MLVGFAAVSTTLVLNGTAIFGTNTDDFDVIFTKSVIDGVDVSNTTISEDGRSITFSTGELAIKDDTSVLNFTVKNNSTQYDASVTMECTADGENAAEYYTITNTIPEVIEAKSSVDGSVTATLTKSSVDKITETFTCTITATATERTEVGKTEWIYTDSDNSGSITIGDVYSFENESFNVISQNEDTVTMLAQYNLGTDYRQSTTLNYVSFSDTNGWEYTPGLQLYEGNAKTYVNEYISYLQSKSKNTNITGNLITLNELNELGCTINEDYTYTEELTCANSNNASWLVNGQAWWTRSAYPDYADRVWRMNDVGRLVININNINYHGVRPIITISKDILN